MAQYNNRKKPVPDIRDGLVFIPDISGFSTFVHSTDVMTGRQITHELLSAVINQNFLGLNIAEVEGDAVLFYRYGTAPALNQLLMQYDAMLKAFDRKREQLESRFLQPLDLSLKVIAHYGPMTEFTIGRFTKLYGEVVVEAHRLLKNSIESNSYLLLTDALLEKTVGAADEELLQDGFRSDKLCEIYGGLKNICFTYFDLSEKRAWKQAA